MSSDDAVAPARILVTRPLMQAQRLADMLRETGMAPVFFPVLEIVPCEVTFSKHSVLEKVNNYQWVIFVSANAVRFACADLTEDSRLWDSKVAVAAVGKATAQALLEKGWPISLVPSVGFNSEALLTTDKLQQVDGCKILIVKGRGGRTLLAQTLTQRGAEVDQLDVYRRILPKVSENERRRQLVETDLSAIVITSGEALQNLLDMAGENISIRLKSIPLVVISKRIKDIAENLGFSRIRVAKEPSDAAIVDIIEALLNGE